MTGKHRSGRGNPVHILSVDTTQTGLLALESDCYHQLCHWIEGQRICCIVIRVQPVRFVSKMQTFILWERTPCYEV